MSKHNELSTPCTLFVQCNMSHLKDTSCIAGLSMHTQFIVNDTMAHCTYYLETGVEPTLDACNKDQISHQYNHLNLRTYIHTCASA